MKRIYEFFEVNLDPTGYWIQDPVLCNRYCAMVVKTRERHEKLTQAFTIARTLASHYRITQEEAFSEFAADIYAKNQDHFDSMTANELAIAVAAIYDGRILEERPDWVGCRPLFDIRFVANKDWELLRIVGIGGSETSTVQGENPYDCQWGLYHKKVGTPMEDEIGAVLDRGHKIEPDIYDWIAELRGCVKVPEYRMMQSIEFPNCTGNFDGIMRKIGTSDYYLFEAKTTSAQNHAKWAGTAFPSNYRCQIQHYCGVLNDPRIKGTVIACFFFVNEFEEDAVTGNKKYWFGGAVSDKTYRLVPRDPEAEQRILSDAQEFWNTYIDFGVEPEGSHLPSEMSAVTKMRAATDIDKDTVIKIDVSENASLKASVNAYMKAEADKKAAEKLVKAAQAVMDANAPEIVKALGTAENAELVGGKKNVKVTYKSLRGPTIKWNADKLNAILGEEQASLCRTLTTCKPTLKVVVNGE